MEIEGDRLTVHDAPETPTGSRVPGTLSRRCPQHCGADPDRRATRSWSPSSKLPHGTCAGQNLASAAGLGVFVHRYAYLPLPRFRKRTVRRWTPHHFPWRPTRLARGRHCRPRSERRSPTTGSRRSRSKGLPTSTRLPFTVRILLENALRYAGGEFVDAETVKTLARWEPRPTGEGPSMELPFLPGRVVLQDFTGVPAVVDLAAMRDAVARLGGDVTRINPLVPADLVIDHSVQVDRFGSTMAFAQNVDLEYEPKSRALRAAALGAAIVPEFPRRASRDRDRAPGQSRVPGAGSDDETRRSGNRRASPTRWSGPTPTRP